MTDDLNAPLGQDTGRKGDDSKKGKWIAALPILGLRVLAGALACFALIRGEQQNAAYPPNPKLGVPN